MTTQAEVLPRELRLGAPPTMPQARSYLFKQRSTQTTYPERGVIQINIPRLQRSYLTKDSYLQFTVELTATPGATLDYNATAGSQKWWNQFVACLDVPGAYGLIDKIEVYDYLGSTLLESTSGHGQLMSLILDAMSNQTTSNKMTAYAGTGKQVTGEDYDLISSYGTAGNTWAVDGSKGIGTSSNTFGPISGQIFKFAPAPLNGFADSATANAAQTISREFSIPLFSFLGLLSPKYVPLHNGYTIQLTLNYRNIAMGFQNMYVAETGKNVNGSVTSFAVKDVAFCAQVLELGPVAESMLLSSTQGNPLIVHTKAYRNYVASKSDSTNQFRMDLNLNVASMSAVLWMMRPTYNLGASASIARSLSQRIRNYLASWYFQYGSSILPQTTGIKAQSTLTYDAQGSSLGASECFIELMKALRKFRDSSSSTAFTDENYRVDTQQTITTSTTGSANLYVRSNVDANSPSPLLLPYNIRDVSLGTQGSTSGVFTSKHDVGRFACGLNLELSPEHSYELVSGLNTNGMNLSINATFSKDKTQQACQIDAWCEYDAFINVTPGLATTVSF